MGGLSVLGITAYDKIRKFEKAPPDGDSESQRRVNYDKLRQSVVLIEHCIQLIVRQSPDLIESIRYHWPELLLVIYTVRAQMAYTNGDAQLYYKSLPMYTRFFAAFKRPYLTRWGLGASAHMRFYGSDLSGGAARLPGEDQDQKLTVSEVMSRNCRSINDIYVELANSVLSAGLPEHSHVAVDTVQKAAEKFNARRQATAAFLDALHIPSKASDEYGKRVPEVDRIRNRILRHRTTVESVLDFVQEMFERRIEGYQSQHLTDQDLTEEVQGAWIPDKKALSKIPLLSAGESRAWLRDYIGATHLWSLDLKKNKRLNNTLDELASNINEDVA